MGEPKILTDEMIDEKLSRLPPAELRYIDPMRMMAWSLDRAVEMVDFGCSKKHIERAGAAGELNLYKVGKVVTVIPADFLVWFKRFKR